MLCVAAISFPWACAVAIDSAANQAPRPGPRSDSDADPEGACFIKISPKNRKIRRKTRMKNEISLSFRQKFGRLFAEIVKCKRCKSLFIL